MGDQKNPWQIGKSLDTSAPRMAGNITYSGTPQNVGPVVRGDIIIGKLAGLPDLNVKIVLSLTGH